ncbi:MAG: hypothetical protein K2N03_05020 [Muribaculaceae bacterium]|nr:hypothetical protein [Muribaculaceae bacterium]
MKKLFTLASLALILSLGANAQNDTTVLFDFANPETLNPSIPTPAQKEAVPLDGYTFTEGEVGVSFFATGSGNTKVRLYGSYDAGCNLRVYDGDSFVVETLENRGLSDNEVFISSIAFDVALSGTVPDVDLISSAGEYDWLNSTWSANGENVKKVTFYSNLQSRISNMQVTLNLPSGVAIIDSDTSKENVWSIDGRKIENPTSPGIYIVRKGNTSYKIIK